MKLYLNGWEADLIERALEQVEAKGGNDSQHAKVLLERIDNCKKMQKPHCNEKHPPDES